MKKLLFVLALGATMVACDDAKSVASEAVKGADSLTTKPVDSLTKPADSLNSNKPKDSMAPKTDVKTSETKPADTSAAKK
jgi:hypothetical protein